MRRGFHLDDSLARNCRNDRELLIVDAEAGLECWYSRQFRRRKFTIRGRPLL